MITAEHLLFSLNVKADRESRNVETKSGMETISTVLENHKNIRPNQSRLVCMKNLPSNTIIL